MPRKISAEDAARMGLVDEGPKKISPEQASKMGLVEAQPEEAEPTAEPSRQQTIVDYIRAGGQKALQLGAKAAMYQANPIATAKALTDMTPTGLGGSVIHGAGKGVSVGFADELEGVRGGLSELRRPMLSEEGARLEGLAPHPVSFSDAYRTARDQRRHDDKASQAAHPDEFAVSEVAGGSALPFGKANFAGRVMQAGLYGGGYGAGNSEATTASGVLKDAGAGLDVGMLTAGAVEAGTAVPRAIGNAGDKMRRGARQELVDRGDALLSKDMASEQGRLGGVTTGVMSDARAAREGLLNPNLDQPQRGALRDFLESGDAVEMERNAADNLIGRLPRRTGQLSEARAAFDEAAARNTPEGAQKYAADELNKSAIKTQVAPRVGRFLQRTVPAVAGTAIGGLLGGTEGALAGSLSGSVIGAAMGHQGTAFANMMKAPVVRDRVGAGLQAVGAPAAIADRATPGLTGLLSDYLRPMTDEEREQEKDWHIKSGL